MTQAIVLVWLMNPPGTLTSCAQSAIRSGFREANSDQLEARMRAEAARGVIVLEGRDTDARHERHGLVGGVVAVDQHESGRAPPLFDAVDDPALAGQPAVLRFAEELAALQRQR